jgi:hypothetical protein
MRIILISFFLTAFLAISAFGQKSIEGKYVRTDNSSCYLILNTDKTFRYKFLRDIQWDLACGQYRVEGDFIFFSYQSDMFDLECNNEKVNYADTSGVILSDAIDKRFRPISGRLRKRKIMIGKVGDVNEAETLGKGAAYYYRRKD